MTTLNKNELEILKSARNLISDPRRWTQGWFAKNNRGNQTNYNSGDATKWCAVGSLFKSAGSEADVCGIILALSKETGRGIVKFNDSSEHSDVIALFDKVIAKNTVAPIKKNTRVGLRLTDSEAEKLNKLATAAGLTKAEYIRGLINAS